MPFIVNCKTGGPSGKVTKRYGPFPSQKQAVDVAQLVADEHPTKTITVEHKAPKRNPAKRKKATVKRTSAKAKRKKTPSKRKNVTMKSASVKRTSVKAKKNPAKKAKTAPPKTYTYRGKRYTLVSRHKLKSAAEKRKASTKAKGYPSVICIGKKDWSSYGVFKRGRIAAKKTKKTAAKKRNPAKAKRRVTATETPTGKTTRGWITREGKLGGPGYTTKKAATRHRLLNRAMGVYGYRSVLGSLQALLRTRDISASKKKTLTADKNWLMKKYGAASRRK